MTAVGAVMTAAGAAITVVGAVMTVVGAAMMAVGAVMTSAGAAMTAVGVVMMAVGAVMMAVGVVMMAVGAVMMAVGAVREPPLPPTPQPHPTPRPRPMPQPPTPQPPTPRPRLPNAKRSGGWWARSKRCPQNASTTSAARPERKSGSAISTNTSSAMQRRWREFADISLRIRPAGRAIQRIASGRRCGGNRPGCNAEGVHG